MMAIMFSFITSFQIYWSYHHSRCRCHFSPNVYISVIQIRRTHNQSAAHPKQCFPKFFWFFDLVRIWLFFRVSWHHRNLIIFSSSTPNRITENQKIQWNLMQSHLICQSIHHSCRAYFALSNAIRKRNWQRPIEHIVQKNKI